MITFYCSSCGSKISAEPEYAGAAASCPTCSHELVVPTQSIASPTDQRQLEHASSSSIQPKPSGQHKKTATKTGKMMMVGIPIVLVAVIVGGVVFSKPPMPKPDVQVAADSSNTTKSVNSTSIGGRLDDFVKKFGGGDSVAVVATERMNYKYTGFGIGDNTVLIVGCDDNEFVTCGVVFKHDGNKSFEAIPLEAGEIENGLRIFSRHEGVDWQEAPVDGGNPRMWGYLSTEKSLKWGSSPLMSIYTSEIPYLIVFSTDSDRSSYKKLGADMRHWQVYAPNQSEPK